MGIKGLFNFIDLEKTSLADLEGVRRIAVDVSCWLHKVKYADNCALALNKNHDAWKCAFKHTFTRLCRDFEVVFVFDGKTPDFKKVEHERRREDFKILKKMY